MYGGAPDLKQPSVPYSYGDNTFYDVGSATVCSCTHARQLCMLTVAVLNLRARECLQNVQILFVCQSTQGLGQPRYYNIIYRPETW